MSRSVEAFAPEVARAWMSEAMALARRACCEGEVPVGALVVCEGRILAGGWNRSVGLCDPTAHAEVIALRRAAARLRNHRLASCVLVTTLEPCTLCLGAIVEARIAGLVVGADDPQRGALEIAGARGFLGWMQRGVAARECATLVDEYFAGKRRRRPSP